MMSKLKKCAFCGSGDIVQSCVSLDYPTHNVKAYVNCQNCNAEVSQRGNVKDSKALLNTALKTWNSRSGEHCEDDQCQPCHNSLQCLAWSQEGFKARCNRWSYFKKHYASGNKKIIGAEIPGELDQ